MSAHESLSLTFRQIWSGISDLALQHSDPEVKTRESGVARGIMDATVKKMRFVRVKV